MDSQVRIYILKDTANADLVAKGLCEPTTDLYQQQSLLTLAQKVSDEQLIYYLKQADVQTYGIHPVKSTDVVAINDRVYLILGGVYTELFNFDQSRVATA